MKRLPRVLLALAMLNAPLSAGDEITGCRDIEAAHALDFWIGDWDVVAADGAEQGTNRIRTILDGCAVTEEWVGASGFEGRSLFYFDSWLSQWRQVWITAVPQRPGSFKEKRMIERLTDGGVRFQGEIMISPEHYVLDRTTLRPLPDGRVHQHIERSNDDGRTWQTGFEGWYSRRNR
jgi:hypothetical protein